MNGHGQSDRFVVPANLPDKASAAEAGEGRERAKGNTDGKTRPGRSAGSGVSGALDRVRQVARGNKEARFTALLHHVSEYRLHLAFDELNPRAAPGVDGVSWAQYEQDLTANLRGLHERVQSGRYRASPSRRAYIPKADGRLRPLGIATLEDKIVQRAVVEVLNAVYEADFPGFSYGFRPGRSPHDALDALSAGIYRKRVNWVLDADIRDFFGQLDRDWLMKFLRHRIADERVLRLVGKWLAAGVIEDGTWTQCDQGSPQGGLCSAEHKPARGIPVTSCLTCLSSIAPASCIARSGLSTHSSQKLVPAPPPSAACAGSPRSRKRCQSLPPIVFPASTHR
jgi:RNA-directed DNA polymerase